MTNKTLRVVSNVGRWFGQLADVQIPAETQYGVRVEGTNRIAYK